MIEATLKLQGPVQRAYAARTMPWTPVSLQKERHLFLPSSKFVLVIDDSPTIRKVVEMTLCREGYETRLFHDGIEAMRWCAGPEARTPDLMLVDLSLPKMDGYSVIQKFKAKPRFAETICIILSQRDGVVDRLKGRMVGAAAYITKPFTTQELVTTIQTSMEQHYLAASSGD